MTRSILTVFGAGHLVEALIHYNHALDCRVQGGSNVDISELLSKSLNKLQTGLKPRSSDREVAGFVALVQHAVGTDAALRRFIGSDLHALGSLRPQVMDHSILRDRSYHPDTAIEPELLRDATVTHRKLVNALCDLDSGHDPEPATRVVKRTAELLYIVRSNIAHGEKTPYGPDLNKRERDESVCGLVVPVQLLLLDLLFDEPSTRLIAYGTLAPGQPNHDLVASLGGTWCTGEVHGTIADEHGLPVLTWRPHQHAAVTIKVLVSTRLSNHWDRIDRFEGTSYRRRLLPVTVTIREATASGTVIANAYVGSEVGPAPPR